MIAWSIGVAVDAHSMDAPAPRSAVPMASTLPWCHISCISVLLILLVGVAVIVKFVSMMLVITAAFVEDKLVLFLKFVSAFGAVWLRGEPYPGVDQTYRSGEFLRRQKSH